MDKLISDPRRIISEERSRNLETREEHSWRRGDADPTCGAPRALTASWFAATC